MSSAAESVLKKHHTLHITYINFGCLCFCSWLRNVSYMWNSVTLIQSNRIVLDGRHKKGIQSYTKPDSAAALVKQFITKKMALNAAKSNIGSDNRLRAYDTIRRNTLLFIKRNSYLYLSICVPTLGGS